MLHLRTLGAPELLRADGTHVTLQRRPFALIAVVAAMGARGMSRQKALGLFWPDVGEERARHALAQTLYALRRSCDADVMDGTDKLRLDPAIVTSDLIDFEKATADGDIEAAAALYSGPFLDGFHLPNANDFERWVEVERARLQRSAAKAIESCAERADAAGRGAVAVELWRRVLALDPLDARVALALVRSLAAAGDAAGALRQADLYQSLRRRELDLPPDAAIGAFTTELRRSSTPTAVHRSTRDAASPLDARIASLETAAPESSTVASLASDTTLGALPRLRSTRLRWGVAFAVAGALIVAAFLAWRQARPLDQRRVVIAVFANRTADTSLAPIGDMASDWVATALARTGLVDVVDSRAVFSSASEAGPAASAAEMASRMRQLAKDVGAGIVVWGNYYLHGDSLEFHAQVTDVRDGALLREIPPIIASAQHPMQGVKQLGERVMGALATIENPRLNEWAARGGTPPSYDAYREFVDGVEAQVRMDPVAALEHYKRARASDSTFLEPLLFAADAEHILGNSARAEAALDTVSAQRDRLIPADRDLLDYQLADIHGEPERAYQVARDMARLSPSSESFVIAGQGALYVARPAEALGWFKRVDPTKGWVKGWPLYWMQATISAHLAGKDDEALRLSIGARHAYPDQVVGYATTVAALAASGRIDQLRAEMDSAATAPGHEWWSYGETLHLAGCELLAHGHPNAAREMWARAVQWYASRGSAANWDPGMRDVEARVTLRAGHVAEAEQLARTLAAAHPVPAYIGTLGVTEAAAGDTSAARAEARRVAHMESVAPSADAMTRGSFALAGARIAAALGDTATMLSDLREALKDQTITIYELHRHPVYHPYVHYPPFERLEKTRG